MIPRDVAVSEAPSHGLTVIDYAPARAARGPTLNFAWRYWIVTKERRLGRGLEALLGQLPGWNGTTPPGQPFAATQSTTASTTEGNSTPATIPIRPLEAAPVVATNPAGQPAVATAPSVGRIANPSHDAASRALETGPVGRIANPSHDANPSHEISAVTAASAASLKLPLESIKHNPHQPRQDFDPDELQRLADSITSHGLLQPVVVRPWEGGYQLIAGERRLRAARLAGWSEVPVTVVEADERQTAELAIVENLQRKDLNALEKAASFQRYLDEYGGTQEELAGRLKLDRSTIANLIRLLELPAAVQDALRRGKITPGHARALLPLGDEREQVAFSRANPEGGAECAAD